ncbi:hypothetical protein TNCV_552731 [Trichonephila clavipes]|nr:hypothetical protein TNCV_552731 [Trichonephila clavipes]
MQSNGCTRLDTGRKGQFLQDFCRLFSWSFFFQTQQQGHEQDMDRLSTYVTMLLVPSNDQSTLVTLTDLAGDSTTCLKLIPEPGDHFRAICSHRATRASDGSASSLPKISILRNNPNYYEKHFLLQTD